MAVQTITYDDKQYLNQNADIPATNKVQDIDMNEIKTVVNNNATILQGDTTYSSNETDTGKTWIDGKPIFRKTVTVTLVSGSTTINVYSGMDYVYFYGSIILDNARLPLNYSNSNAPIFTFADENKITINQTNFVGGTAYIVVEYTKTTD